MARIGIVYYSMYNFLDQTGPLWGTGALVGTPAGFGSTRTGGSPYGAFSPPEGKDGLSDDEVAIARGYGALFHGIAAKLAA